MTDLTLDSPSRRFSPAHPTQSVHPARREEAEDRFMPPPGPELKRRRFERSPVPLGFAPMGLRVASGPGTPFPLHAHQQMTLPRSVSGGPGPSQVRRPSLPRPAELFRGGANHPSSTTAMAPPPHPVLGYGQQRMDINRHPPRHDLSLTLPPLQTNAAPARQNNMTIGSAVSSTPMTAALRKHDSRPIAEVIMAMPLLHKINILRQMDLPVKSGPCRAAIVAIEGDDADAARDLADWLGEFLGRDGEIDVSVMDGPKVPRQDVLKKSDLFDCVREWDDKSIEIRSMAQDLGRRHSEQIMFSETTHVQHGSRKSSDDSSDTVDIDTPSIPVQRKPVLLLRTHTLTATNMFSCRIPVTGAYGAEDHWRWTACIWRDVVAADMTVYLRDVAAKDSRESGSVDVMGDKRVMVVSRVRGSDERSEKAIVAGIEPGALRRLGFEVGEWVRGH